jgi:flagella basal body P-ring formation protein FlgA
MKSLILTLTVLCVLSTADRLHAVVMELRDQQTLIGDNVKLNDLLKSSQGLSDDDLNASIGAAPSLGKSDSWTRDKIEKALPASLKQQSLEWNGATACMINRPAVSYSEKDVKQLITAEIAKRLPADSNFAILEMPGLDPFLVPQGQLEISVELAPNSLRSEWTEAMLKFHYQGQLAVTKSVRFHWAYTRPVWEVSNRVAAGDDLAASSFQQVEVNVLTLPGLLQPASDFPDGKVAAHAMAQGKLLMENDWVEPVLVNRNDICTIVYEHHGISITVMAKAMDKGVLNQVIAVQNLTSHKVFNARVVDERNLVYEE